MTTLLTAFRFAILMMMIGGLFYPLLITGLGQIFFPQQSNGSLIEKNGELIGSTLIGQSFSKPQYFHPRPAVNGYDASNSGGSNLGATSKKLIERIAKDSQSYLKENLTTKSIPIDAVTASASNLDPHISLANALLQIPRVAKARAVKPEALHSLVTSLLEQHLLAEAPYINVLELNLALDQQQAR